jgi:hypothetical protein
LWAAAAAFDEDLRRYPHNGLSLWGRYQACHALATWLASGGGDGGDSGGQTKDGQFRKSEIKEPSGSDYSKALHCAQSSLEEFHNAWRHFDFDLGAWEVGAVAAPPVTESTFSSRWILSFLFGVSALSIAIATVATCALALFCHPSCTRASEVRAEDEAGKEETEAILADFDDDEGSSDNGR